MKKVLRLFIALFTVIFLASCTTSVREVESIEFTNAPAASYNKGEVVKAESFQVVISFTEGNPLPLKLNDSRLTVIGLDGDKLDTKTPGRKTINITYRGFSVSVSYEVEDVTHLSYWSGHIATEDASKTLEDFASNGIATVSQLAQFAKLVNENPNATAGVTYSLLTGAEYDLEAHQWVPIVDFQGTFNGDGATIKNLRMTNGSDDFANKGLFGKTKGTVEIKDLTFDGTLINSVTDGLGETNKNFAAVVGNVSAGTTTITNVIVKNSIIVGHGRLGALVGQTNGTVIINNSKSLDNSFTAVNGYAAKSADGNGDKVAGLVGLAQKEITINNSKVISNIINGTRDLGGLVGYVSLKATLNGNKVEDTIIQASVPGGMLPAKGTRSIGAFVGTLAGTTTLANVTDFVLGTDEDVNTFNGVSLLANTLYEELTVTGELFGGYRAKADYVRNIVIGAQTYQLKSIVTPNEGNIADYALDIEEITAFLFDVYNGVENPVIPTGLTNVEITLLA